MAIREVVAPKGTRNRESKYKFSTKDVADALALITDGKLAGAGVFKGNGKKESALREARSAAANLARKIVDANPGTDVGTKAWYDADSGEAVGAVKLR
jgi:hypothetical protein